MKGLLSQFDESLMLALAVGVAALAVATVVGIRYRRAGRLWLQAVGRILTTGSVGVVILATALPRSARIESDGDLVLTPGRGGLGDLGQILADPTSLAGVLLLSNLVLYIAVAFFAVYGWHEKRWLVLPACLGLSVLVEAIQFLLLGRVAATDDVILNMAGGLIGYVAAVASLRFTSSSTALVGNDSQTA